MIENIDDGSQNIVTKDLLPNDVLLGRGTGPNEHIGNCLFRDEVESHKDAYISAPDKATEERIVSEIISAIYKNRGRFLKKMDSQQDLTGKPMYEVVVDKKLLAYKIKQAIRYSKRRDKKLEAEASKQGEKISDGSAALVQVGDTSEAPKAQASSQLSYGRPFGTSPNLLSGESEQLLLMAQNASARQHDEGISQSPHNTPPSHQSTHELQRRPLPQHHLIHPTTASHAAMAQNQLARLEPTASNAFLSRDVLDQLAMLHLQRTDPMAYQLVVDRRRQQQETVRLERLRLQQQLGLSPTEQQLLQERSSALQQTMPRSTFVADTMRNVAMIRDTQQAVYGGQRRGSMDAPTSQNDEKGGDSEKDSKEPSSKRPKTS